ncbi:Lysophospholipase L1 [Actinopolyspora xinjiangensis]|uniref:Lysophospholipase L1 n=1 Tax=Actinopolyspora xinjiangensis TaxID=405564 RepID=A0A1H0TNB1_9ACTN|nr:SGNH/GDSL hydrolase family protein [Actinopolyspora xinjiangensis]SDP55046.1 Lysophospholipase L1 [Actinopolyspora xinjiangensis]
MRKSALSNRCSTVLAAVLLPFLAPVASAATAEDRADAVEYVALGDSYASGVGIGNYTPESGDCLRSPQAYPELIADRGLVGSLDFVACGGAKTPDVVNEQVAALSASTDVVTVSVGGNDAGFGEVVTTCTTGGDQACDDVVTEAENYATQQLPAELAGTYDAIADAAPAARVAVVGYPRLFELGPCLSLLSEFERGRLNEAADTLNSVIAEQAEAAGFSFRDVREEFAGHGVCGGQPWINGLSYPIEESFHPNAAGHEQGFLPELAGFFDAQSSRVR